MKQAMDVLWPAPARDLGSGEEHGIGRQDTMPPAHNAEHPGF